jgi:hypothetical protein
MLGGRRRPRITSDHESARRASRPSPDGSLRTQSLGERVHRVELDPIDESVLVDRPGVRRAVAQRLAVGLPSASDVFLGDRRERKKFDRVDRLWARAEASASTPLADGGAALFKSTG